MRPHLLVTMKQEKFWKDPPKEHGGELAKGKRKTARPIVTKSPMHTTFKSLRAKGKWSFHKFDREIEETVYAIAKRLRIRIYNFQNVGNHLHMVLQAANRREMQNFLRELPNKVCAIVTGTKRGNAIGRFWDGVVHTRVVYWGKDFFGMQQYMTKNEMEACGAPRKLVDEMFKQIRLEMRLPVS